MNPDQNDCEPSTSSHIIPCESDPDSHSQLRQDTVWLGENEDQVSDLGYSGYSSQNTIELLRATDRCSELRPSSPGLSRSNVDRLENGRTLKYRDLVRQLPPPVCVDILVQTFFSHVNWQCDVLDEQRFHAHLQAWRRVTDHDLRAGPGALPPEARIFPALLLQICAHALLFHDQFDERLTSLMNLQGMTFTELGKEYSDTSANILTLLGKRAITIATLQAGLLRAAFLKSSGEVVEAWHILGATIRDAQELGLNTNPSRSSRNSSDGLRIWILLHIWDTHMGVVLGRPIATDVDLDTFIGKVTDITQRDAVFSHWKSENDPPRPFDIILAGYNVAYKYFPDIHRLGEATTPQDREVVDDIHKSVEVNMGLLPPWCRLEDPDTKFDELPQCQWLPIAREGLSSLVHLVILTLHRPYMFLHLDSCRKAVRAGLAILSAQERIFQKVGLQQCRIFNPVYASFDAMVLVAAAHLVVPGYVVDLRGESVQAIATGVERLDAIGRHNPMARSAHTVVTSLYCRLEDRFATSSATDTVSLQLDSGTSASSENRDQDITPPQPLHDLFYSDLFEPHLPSNAPAGSLSSDWISTNFMNGWDADGMIPDLSFWDEFLTNPQINAELSK